MSGLIRVSKRCACVFSASFLYPLSDLDETLGEREAKIPEIFKSITDHETALF